MGADHGRSRLRSSALALSSLLMLGACGGGGADRAPSGGPAAIRTLAYVSTECREDAEGFTVRQELRIVRGDGEVLRIGAPISSGPRRRGPSDRCADLQRPRAWRLVPVLPAGALRSGLGGRRRLPEARRDARWIARHLRAERRLLPGQPRRDPPARAG